MNLQVEDLGHSRAKLTVTVPPEDVEKALQKAYIAKRRSFNIPGFRKGKAPRDMIEKMYGPQIFYNEAADNMLQESYSEVFSDGGLDIVLPPKFSIEQIEKGRDFIYTAEVILRPDVQLGEYKGMTVDQFSTEVTDTDINDQIELERLRNARRIEVTDNGVAVQDRDEICLDFEGFIDGEPFKGGKDDGYWLTIGSGAFIPGFEEQLIGAKVGEEKEVNVTFPEDYHEKKFAGRQAMFKCTVRRVMTSELPDLDDEFASEVSSFETFDEYRNDVAEKLRKRKEESVRKKRQAQAVSKAVDNAVIDIPDEMIDTKVRQMIDDFEQSIERQGVTLDDYMKATGRTIEEMAENLRPDVRKSIATRLVLEAVVKAENIEISDESVQEQLKSLADEEHIDINDIKSYFDKERTKRLKEEMAVDAAIALITKSAVVA